MRRLRELQAEWKELGAERPFHLRNGINTGYCTVGNFGSEDRMDYTIIGSVVNLAARLQAHAGLDGIIDSLRTTQHLVEMFRRSLPDGAPRRCLDRVSNRLTKILAITRKLGPAE